MEDLLVKKNEANADKSGATLDYCKCPDENHFGININKTTPKGFLLNATSNNFSSRINCRNLFLSVLFFTTLNLAHNAPLPPPPVILVFSITSSNPLHMVLGDSPHVTTDITEVQGYFDPNALIVTLNSNGQGIYYLSDIENTYFVAIDSDNNIKPLLESEIPSDDMYTFREEATDNAEEMRYYLQTGGEKYYLAASNGKIVAINADDVAQNDAQSRFRIVYT